MSSTRQNNAPWMDLDESLVDTDPVERRGDNDIITLGRRSFLSALGLSGVVSLTACERLPVEQALPLLEPNEDVRPGTFVRYASTCTACSAACGMLVTVRDGRPIKLEGHPEHPLSKGGLCALGQAGVRGLYDGGRLQKPQLDGKDSDWGQLDARVAAGLKAAGGKAVVVLSPTLVSPTARRTITAFLEPYGGRLVEHDPELFGSAPLVQAYRSLDGKPRYPALRIGNAEFLLTLGGDLLGTGAEHIAHTRQYADGRRARAGVPPDGGRRFRHVHVGGSLTLTGSAADQRIQAAAAERSLIAANLLKVVAAGATGAVAELAKELTRAVPAATDPAVVKALAAELKPNRSLVVSGSRNAAEQLSVALLNRLLGAEDNTLQLQESTRANGGGDGAVAQLLADINGGKVGALFVLDHNPVEQLPGGDALAAKIGALPLSVALSTRPTATVAACKVAAAAHHDLERWGDAAPQTGVLSLVQPTIVPLFDTRDPMECFLRWSGSKVVDYRAHLAATWQTELAAGAANPKAVWTDALSRGMATPAQAALAFAPPKPDPDPDPDPASEPVTDPESDPAPDPEPGPDRVALAAVMAALANPKVDLEVELIEEVGPRDGRGSFNPWLRELPDPITRASWTAVARLAPALARAQGIKDGDGVRITVGDATVEMQARIVPGQHPKVIGVPVGYGVKDGDAGEAARNGYRLAKLDASGMTVAGLPASLARSDGKRKLPLMQWHSSTEGRPIVHQVESVNEKIKQPHHGEHSLWGGDADYKYAPHWHMTIDLDACTGCSACVVACQAENNLPVVGPKNITDHRDMYWLRIDRYYEGDEDNPEVLFEPMLCAQCDSAPCETVCPVAATVHSHDGLNMQAYNRCVGTRYCANNCPYKVRRFNWFDFTHKDPLERMVLNPDVVVRERGTMEKCTFCVQRIQLARIEGKAKGDEWVSEVQTACQQSCPARAIHFGDNNTDEEIAEQRHAGRSFQVLADLGVRPSITYLARARNRKPSGGGTPT